MDVQELADLERLRQLKARYFRLMDTKQWEQWADVFTEDVVFDLSEEADVTLEGRDAVVEFVRNALAGATSVHHGHTPELELTGPDTARGIWAMQDQLEFAGDPPVRIVGSGHYTEEYARGEDGRWRIRHSKLTRLRRDVS